MTDVTRVLASIQQGNSQAAEQLLPLVYEELRRIAAQQMVAEKPGQTLQATALVHEAYLRLVGKNEHGPAWDSRGHFFAAAAKSMRRILVDNARRKARVRHGGQRQRVALTDVADLDDERLVALDDALERLAAEDPHAAQVVELHHFAGVSHEIVAETLQITVYQARQKWTYAQAWLRDALGP